MTASVIEGGCEGLRTRSLTLKFLHDIIVSDTHALLQLKIPRIHLIIQVSDNNKDNYGHHIQKPHLSCRRFGNIGRLGAKNL